MSPIPSPSSASTDGLSAAAASLAPLPRYRAILLAADASDHSNQGVRSAVSLGLPWQSTLTGAHVYAAKLHDVRFRQMEGGLPEQYKEETELERQRDIHDDLITKGLSVITDSYLDEAQRCCTDAGLTYIRRSLEGKNYREMSREANSGKYDLLVMGARGLGAIDGSRIGTVCERVVRRSAIDTLVIKDASRDITSGPIVVAVDGSSRGYAGLLSAFAIHQAHQTPIHVISAYDPYYHYVAFNRIAEVLSEEAGKIFRFKEQEALHESIIDEGLAKIYDGHLHVARSIAADYGIDIQTELLDGKAHDAIEKYLCRVDASLLVLGKLGIHADDELDIGGNTENLLRNVDCALLICQRHFKPQVEVLAEATTSWTHQAEARMQKIPSFAQGMAKMAILRFAQERGHTVITESIVREATDALCPVKPGSKTTIEQQAGHHGDQPYDPRWSDEAEAILAAVRDPSMRNNLRRRAEKKARQQHSETVLADHVRCFMAIEKQPEQMAEATSTAVDPGSPTQTERSIDSAMDWSADALSALQRVPEGSIRNMARDAAQTIARESGKDQVDGEFFAAILGTFSAGSAAVSTQLPWSDEAHLGISRAPEMVRGMLIREIETYAREQGMATVERATVDQVKQRWSDNGHFHQGQSDHRAYAEASGSDSETINTEAINTEAINIKTTRADPVTESPAIYCAWQADALERLQQVPEGFMRQTCQRRIEHAALQQGSNEVTLALVQQQLSTAATVMENSIKKTNGKCPFKH